MGTEAKTPRRPAAHVSLRIKVASAVGAHDWPTVEKTYNQYGSYLELTGDDKPIGMAQVLTWPKRKEDN